MEGSAETNSSGKVRRIVFVRLKPAFAQEPQLQQVIAQTNEVLPKAPMVESVEVVRSADQRTQQAWHLCLLVTLTGVDQIEPYRIDPVHRAFADVFLKPMTEKIAVYNFV